jgi:CRISPR type III-associated protein (TIGR04423 family)
MKKEDIVKTINEKYRDYEGYVQFSHRPIDKEKDIFHNGKKVAIEDESGFVYEAHFFNGTDSIAIKQINDRWYVDETKNTPLTDTQSYFTKDKNLKVKMAQIWEPENDPLCENMPVLKLKKVVFAGFEGGNQ